MMDSTTRAHTGKTAATAKAMARLKTRRTLRGSKRLSCGSNGGSIGFHLVFDSAAGSPWRDRDTIAEGLPGTHRIRNAQPHHTTQRLAFLFLLLLLGEHRGFLKNFLQGPMGFARELHRLFPS